MKRDLDEIRRLLLVVEACDDPRGKAFFWKDEKKLGNWGFKADPFPQADELNAHLDYQIGLLEQAGFVTRRAVGANAPNFVEITYKGHDYLDAIRSDTVWDKTTAGVAKVGGMSLDMIKELAIAYMKQEAAEKLGIKL
ncbi:DUF2513 domain-containing protein [Sulfitobacter sp. PS-8MA]|uniref:DUF2513 domain-containing protein n=1 Tax=Sulfitobacter sp. PS-8MA TaxID=3237707 RepID=UPI0034C6D329